MTRIALFVSRDGWTRQIQVSIETVEDDGGGHGYRIAGPKFNGSSKRLLSCELSRRDAAEIRKYLDMIDGTASEPKEVVHTEWGVAYGGEDGNDCAGMLTYNDEAEAAETVQWIHGGFLVRRQVATWPWERADAT